jgi:hypothetical protein
MFIKTVEWLHVSWMIFRLVTYCLETIFSRLICQHTWHASISAFRNGRIVFIEPFQVVFRDSVDALGKKVSFLQNIEWFQIVLVFPQQKISAMHVKMVQF